MAQHEETILIKRNTDEIIGDLICKHQFRHIGYDFGERRISQGDSMDGVMVLRMQDKICELYHGDKYKERTIAFLRDILDQTGIKFRIEQFMDETSFETIFEYRPQSLQRIFRMKNIFSNDHEYLDTVTGKSVFVVKYSGEY